VKLLPPVRQNLQNPVSINRPIVSATCY